MISSPVAKAETGTVTAEFAFNDLGRLQQNSDGTVVRTTVQKTAAITATLEVLGAGAGGEVEEDAGNTPALEKYRSWDQLGFTATGADNSAGTADTVTFDLDGYFETSRTDTFTLTLTLTDANDVALTDSNAESVEWTVDCAMTDAEDIGGGYYKYDLSSDDNIVVFAAGVVESHTTPYKLVIRD